MRLGPSVLVLLFNIFTYPTTCESLKCYECSGNVSCGYEEFSPIIDCAGKCTSYRNEDDNGKEKDKTFQLIQLKLIYKICWKVQ